MHEIASSKLGSQKLSVKPMNLPVENFANNSHSTLRISAREKTMLPWQNRVFCTNLPFSTPRSAGATIDAGADCLFSSAGTVAVLEVPVPVRLNRHSKCRCRLDPH